MKQGLVMLAALLLAGCGSQESDDPGNASAGDASGTATEGPRLQPGQWEVTTRMLRMEAAGLPDGSLPSPPPQTMTQCVTPELARTPMEGITSGALPPDCVSEQSNVTDDRLQAVFSCAQDGLPSRIAIDGTFAPTSYRLDMNIRAGQGENVIRTDMRVEARRIGDCQNPGAS